MKHILFSGIIVGFLSGCGGGGVSPAQNAVKPTGNNIGTIFDGPIATITMLPTMPASGTGVFTPSEVVNYDAMGTLDLSGAVQYAPTFAFASYDGFVKLIEAETRFGITQNVYIGRASVDVDFINSRLDGVTTDFFRNTGTPGNTVIANQVQGTIPITIGSTIGDEFIAVYNGSLTDRGRTLDIQSNISGIFAKSNGQDLAIGNISGLVGTPANATLLNGQFVTAK